MFSLSFLTSRNERRLEVVREREGETKLYAFAIDDQFSPALEWRKIPPRITRWITRIVALRILS